MSIPFFSIVIPTRNRPETLPYALATCLHQEGNNDYEVIVSDNSDSRESLLSYESIEPYLGKKVRYVRPSEVLPMTEHWEFALNFASGKYVTYLGDDDGLMQDALASYKACIDQTGALALTSNAWHYIWPGTFNGREAKRNCTLEYIRWPLRIEKAMKADDEDDWETLNSRYQMQGFLNFEFDQQSLPCIYRGIVANSLIQDIRKQKGFFFDSVIPDCYSALIVSLNTPIYYMIRKPIRIVGTSPKSNGLATNSSHTRQGDALVKKDFERLIESKKIVFAITGVVPWEAHLESMLYARTKNEDITINLFSFYIKSIQSLIKDSFGNIHSLRLLRKYLLISSLTQSRMAFFLGLPLAFLIFGMKTFLSGVKCIVKTLLTKVGLYRLRYINPDVSKKLTNVYEVSIRKLF